MSEAKAEARTAGGRSPVQRVVCIVCTKLRYAGADFASAAEAAAAAAPAAVLVAKAGGAAKPRCGANPRPLLVACEGRPDLELKCEDGGVPIIASCFAFSDALKVEHEISRLCEIENVIELTVH